ncbi:MAG: glycosyltransferase family 2 protein [Gallionella sp.]|nr:glycosyltransferase family 2 protein [Gallionella sp.]
MTASPYHINDDMTNTSPTPLVTVIVAVFNGVTTLQHCIDSVIQQSYPNKELIIIDGGSKDGTVDLLKKNNDSINYWISEPDHGIYNAWNKALMHAKGEWICFLGADDYFWNDLVLERMTAELVKVPAEISVAYGQVMLINEAGESLYPVGNPWEIIKGKFMQVMCIPHQGTMHRRSLFERNGIFDESFRVGGDYEFLLRELKSAEAVFIPSIVVAGMRLGGISSTPANSIEMLRDFRRAQLMHGQRMPSFKWMMALSKVYLRLVLWRMLGEKSARKALDFARRIVGLPKYWTRS